MQQVSLLENVYEMNKTINGGWNMKYERAQQNIDKNILQMNWKKKQTQRIRKIIN